MEMGSAEKPQFSLTAPGWVKGPLRLREAPEPGKTQYVYNDEGEVQGLLIVQPPPPRNRLEAMWRNLRRRASLLWRHGIWD
jgi:hypothetical protein